MGRQFASRLAIYQSDTPQYVTIDIIEYDDGEGVEAEHYSNLKATFSEKTIKAEKGPFEEPATKPVYVFMIQPQGGELPTIQENYRVRYNSEDLEIIAVNNSSGHIQLVEVMTETGRL